MAGLEVFQHTFEPRHNTVAFLEDTRDSAIPFRPMIEFLRRSRIFHAITANANLYSDHVGTFWTNAVINQDLEHTRIISRVFDREITVTEQLIREVLRLDDNSNMPIQFSNEFIAGGMNRMGYPGVPKDQYRKANLTRVWRFLMHIMIVCISSRRAGFDGISHQVASGMLALVYNKPYNFSGYIFRAMIENIKLGNKRWQMYPRFLQLIINHQLPGLPINPINKWRQTPMNLRIFAVCGSYGKGVPVPADVPLFGHVINENYVAPSNDGFLDLVAPAPQQPIIQEPADVANILRDIDDFVDVPIDG